MEDLESRLKSIQNKITANGNRETALNAQSVAAAIGAETPVTILSDLRDVQCKTLDMLVQMRDLSIEHERNKDVRHKEVCTLLMGLMSKSSHSTLDGTGIGQSLSSNSSTGKQDYYYGNTRMGSGVHSISCVLMHLDTMLAEHPQFNGIQNSDTTYMDIKEWHTITTTVLRADKLGADALRIPKPSEEDFKAVCRLMAATAIGRRPKCEPSHVKTLMTTAPGVLNAANWVREALLQCKGILSPEREYRFKHLLYPFVDEETELSLEPETRKVLNNRRLHRDVSALKVTQAKE